MASAKATLNSLIIVMSFFVVAKSEVGHWTYCDAQGPFPPARYSHTAINDLAHNRMIIYGGYSAVNQYTFGDIWALSGEDLTWTHLYANNDGPRTIMAHAAMYDDITQSMVVFGGLVEGSLTNDLWILDLNSMTWENVPHSDPWPSPRMCLYATYGLGDHQMLIFGGRSSYSWFDDIWLLDLSSRTWQQIQYSDTSITPREGVPEAYIDNSLMLLYGGWMPYHSYYDEIWMFSFEHNDWMLLEPPDPHPVPRNYNTVIYDPKRDFVLIWGGFCGYDGPGLNDLWKFDLNTLTYEQLEEEGDVPSPRGRHSTIMGHFAGHRATIFGGANMFREEFNTTYFLDWETPTTVDDNILPAKFDFVGSYPNPFNTNTILQYSLNEPGSVAISIFDLQGRKVTDLVDGFQTAGQHSLTWEAKGLTSGVYFAQLTASGQSQSKKIILLK